MDIDVMLLPYGAERYRYQPVLCCLLPLAIINRYSISEMNPEILQEFTIGEAVKLDSVDVFQAVGNFVNTFEEKKETYKQGLIGANEKYGQDKLIQHIIKIFNS